VFTGGEDVEQGHARHPPAVAYWRIHVALRRGSLVLELNARRLTIQIARRRGLRPVLDAVARAALPADVLGRVALGRRLSALPSSSRPARAGS